MNKGQFDLAGSVQDAAFVSSDGSTVTVLVSATGYQVTSSGQVPDLDVAVQDHHDEGGQLLAGQRSAERGAGMSDDEPTVTPEQDEAPTEPRRPQPGASAASRARRIGGRPLPGPGKAAGTTTSAAPVPAARPAGRGGQHDDYQDSYQDDHQDDHQDGREAEDRTGRRAAARGPQAGHRVPPAPAAGRPPSRRVETREPKRRDAEATLARLRWVPAVVLGLAAVVLAPSAASSSATACGGPRSRSAPSATRCWPRPRPASARSPTTTTASCPPPSRPAWPAPPAPSSRSTSRPWTPSWPSSRPRPRPCRPSRWPTPASSRSARTVRQWVVLVYGQQAVTNAESGSSTPRLDILSARVTLEKVGGQWRVAELKRL